MRPLVGLYPGIMLQGKKEATETATATRPVVIPRPVSETENPSLPPIHRDNAPETIANSPATKVPATKESKSKVSLRPETTMGKTERTPRNADALPRTLDALFDESLVRAAEDWSSPSAIGAS